MLKRVLIFFGVLMMCGFICYKARELPLAYFVLTPFLFFPLFYYYHEKDWLFLVASSAAVFLIFLCGFIRESMLEVLLFGVGYVLLFGAIAGYRRLGLQKVNQEALYCREAQRELDNLKQKYHTRLESLHRLEKQVSSLMELFEIARNFSECLSFEEMVKLLREKVLPELPFSQMRFILLAPDAELKFLRNFLISQEAVKEETVEFIDEDLERFARVCKYKEMLKVPVFPPIREKGLSHHEQWIFPLTIEGAVAALVIVEGGHPEDLVRFEVLASHLVLQVKKIRLYETVRELSIIDDLTGVYVRRHFLERFNEELRRNIKYHHPLAVLMLDIDHFKRYNDEFGHLVGDATLKEVAMLLRQNLRKVDIVARYGGEEFVAVLPETSAEAAIEVAERIRSNIARHHFKVYDVMAQVTVSLGISIFPDNIPEEKRNRDYPDLAYDLIRFADKALYQAKEEGRNRVYCYQDLQH